MPVFHPSTSLRRYSKGVVLLNISDSVGILSYLITLFIWAKNPDSGMKQLSCHLNNFLLDPLVVNIHIYIAHHHRRHGEWQVVKVFFEVLAIILL